MFNWLEVMVHQERHKDLLREVERDRLVRQALAGRAKRDHLHCRALIWLGRRLVAWGWSLQARYDAAVEVPALQALNHCR
jgi:hypothetical protein